MTDSLSLLCKDKYRHQSESARLHEQNVLLVKSDFLLQQGKTHLVDAGKPADGIFLDFCKAFGTESPRMLLDKVSSTELDKHIVGWESNWLRGQAPRVAVTGDDNPLTVVTSGFCRAPLPAPALQHLPEGPEGIISEFTDDTKLGGAVACLEGREAPQRDLTTRDGQSPTVWSLTRAVSGSAPGMGHRAWVYALGR